MNRKTAMAAAVAAALTMGTVMVASSQSPALASGTTANGAGPQAMTTVGRLALLDQADKEAGAVAKALGLGPDERLLPKDVQVDNDGARHVRYDRTYRGLPVVGGDLVVHRAKNGRITSTSWAHEGAIKLNGVTPMLSDKDAASTATRSAKHVKEARTTNLDTSQLLVWAVGKVPVLAYRNTVTGAGEAGANSREAVLLDAGTGAVLDQYEVNPTVSGTGNGVNVGQVTIETSQGGSGYTLTDAAHGGTIVYDSYNSPQSNPAQNARTFSKSSNSWGNGSTSSRESAAVDASYGLAKTWDYYKSTFNRSGIRNDGRGAPAYVHVDNQLLNAFYDDSCFCMSFGDGSSQNGNTPLTALDVAGHEMSHGVTAATANLNYSGESGGLNEATSDIFGTMVEFYAGNTTDPGDYYIGEKLRMGNGYLRRMDNPAADGNSLSCYSSRAGSVDVHYSSGIANHFFYLTAEGTGAKTIGGLSHNGTPCNGDSFNGIGRDKAAQIWYRALSTYLTSTSNYSAARTATLQAAADLYGANSQERYIVSKAWAAVSLGTALPDPGNGNPSPSPTPTSSPTGNPNPGGNALTNGDFEQGTAGWTQSANDITNSTQQSAHGGSWYAWMMGYGSAATETLSQSNIAVPSTGSPKLTFWLKVTTAESGTTAYDTLKVNVNGQTLATYSNANASAGYVQKTVDLSAFRGQNVSISFAGQEDAYLATTFLLDDVSVG
ncbi:MULTISPECIES: M4 family metallopeptidase [Kitasatospora]|uniref:Putative zinc metallopeptidase n=1 Tax=Kitasatospora setae (strain ATCC 33774 / DSM 43861 / JCM 3304 / KCC A-0304 / NBRC 14216 / KM-6054) TaxID=452652 RepID=E4NIZ9_KITSK|nr:MULTISPECIES: M4 family metallopeptidase [Kitasatospora]BAJ32947.1 putative zinc metallopeptidase [Kitasatospora setae KM-6054]